MPATIVLNEWNGGIGSPVKTSKAASIILPRANDSAVVDSLNPVPIPKAGVSRSYEKWLRFRIGATGPAGTITNLKFYTGGVNLLGSGIMLYAGAEADYDQPTVADSTYATVDALTYVVGGALSLGAGPFSSINTDIGEFCVLQVDVSPIAAEGLSGTMVPTFSYDET